MAKLVRSKTFEMVLAGFLVVFSPLANAQNEISSTRQCLAPEPEIIKMFEDFGKIFRGTGSSLAILLEDEIVLKGGYGMANIEAGVPNSPETLYQIASVTKAFTAAALLKLYEEGEIDLDAPIQTYVPNFPEPENGVVTLRLLAAHLGGIRHYKDGERTPEFFSTHYNDVMDALALFRDDPFVGDPGGQVLYSSYGYNLIAAAIQKASGMPFQEYVEKTIFEPLGLENTRFDDIRVPVFGRAQPYTFYEGFTYVTSDFLMRAPQLDMSYNPGGGNILSTPIDLVNFSKIFMEPGFFKGKTLDLFYHRQAVGEAQSSWGFGFRIDDSEFGKKFLLSGSVPGFQATVYIFPEHQLSIAVVGNSWGLRPETPPEITDPLLEAAKMCLGAPAS